MERRDESGAVWVLLTDAQIERLLAAKRQRRLTLEQIAAAVGYHAATVSRWLARSPHRREQLTSAASVYGHPLESALAAAADQLGTFLTPPEDELPKMLPKVADDQETSI